jgi:hypothetical protein
MLFIIELIVTFDLCSHYSHSAVPSIKLELQL